MTAQEAAMRIAIDMLHNTLALMMAARILRVRIRPLWIGFASFFGAASALSAKMAAISHGKGMLLWLPIALVMMRIATDAGRAWRKALVLLTCEGFLGGVVLALSGATDSLLLANALSVVPAGAFFVNTFRVGRTVCDSRSVRIACVIGGRTFEFDAIVDSGNSLRDYLSLRPVIVVGMDALGQGVLQTLRTRPIFADTAGGRQMMQMLLPERTTIYAEGTCLVVEAALAFSPGLGRRAPALAPASLLDEQNEGIYQRRGN